MNDPLGETRWTAFLAVMALAAGSPALAQETSNEAGAGLLEEVKVTARKRVESAQDTPIAVTAFNAQQLETLKVRDLSDFSVGLPNVALDHVATYRGAANFSIRGLGINSSIPSIDPTVGVFIDGVYMGQLGGIVLDMFDIESLEILRGPQGTLFGRNVTGGAVLVNTRRPASEFEVSARVALDGNPNGDGGLNRYFMGEVSGPIADRLAARFSVYRNNDEGWHVNLANGEDFGESETTILRPSLRWEPTDAVTVNLRWEHFKSNGQGPASQTHTNGTGVPGFFANFERDSFDFAIDEEGFIDLRSDLVSLEVNWDVAPGDGTITNIFGWRDFRSNGVSDVDSQPVWLFHAPFWNNSEQFSNELRYFGTFDRLEVTTGVFWFTQEINYHERRELLGVATGGVAPALTQDGGGDYDVDSLAAFAHFDYALTDQWDLVAGIRYTHEKKSANIASLVRNVNSPCNVVFGTCPFDFVDSESWGDWSGKLGATWTPSDEMLLYGHWARAQRSGGYNLRNTAIDTVNLGPGPFDTETVDSFELGMKWDLPGRGRVNAAVFYNLVDDMQREINFSDPFAGVVQVIRNSADAEVLGLEVEGTFVLTDNLVLQGSLGWMDPSYRTVKFDLNGDGVIDGKDKALDLPRAPDLTWSLGLIHDLEFANGGRLSSRINYAYRDRSIFTDNNLGFFLSQDVLDAGVDYDTPGGRWTFSLYGRNLLDSVMHGGDTQLPDNLGGVAPVGGTFSPLAKGRVAGVQVTWRY